MDTRPPPIRSPTLIGRGDALATSLHELAQMRAGTGRCLLVSGEAGIGKSRLVAEVAAVAQAQGVLLLRGQCFPADLAYPYAPLLDMVRSHLALPHAALQVPHLAALARQLGPLLPELAPSEALAAPLGEPEQEKRRLFAVLVAFFLDCAARVPTLLVLEDLHWSDDTSLAFLHRLVRHSAAHRLMVLATYRPDEAQPPLRGWLAQLDRERAAEEIRLAALGRDELAAMLDAIFDAPHLSVAMRRLLHGELLDTLITLTDGNPFVVEELLRALVAADVLRVVDGIWQQRAPIATTMPRSLAAAVERQIATLSATARQVLTLAAVAGRQFDFALLQDLTGHNETQLVRLMHELVAAQLVVEASADQFTFRHALMRETIAAQLLTRERRALHQTIAEALERLPQAPGAQHVEAIAYHFFHAELWSEAEVYARRAGIRAAQLYAHRVAITYLSWAITASQHQGHRPDPALLRLRGRASEALGEFDAANHDYDAAFERARTDEDAVAAWHAAIDLGCLWAGRDYLQAETWFRQAVTLAQAHGDPALHAQSLNRIGNWQLNREQPLPAIRAHQEALALFEQLHDAQGIADTLDLLGMANYLAGDLRRGTEFYRRAVAQFQHLGNKPGLTSSLATLTLRGATYQTDSLAGTTSLAEVRQDAEQALQIARAIGHRAAEAYALLQLGLCLGASGDYGPGLSAARQSLIIAEEIEHRQWQTAAYTVLGGMYRGLLAFAEAQTCCAHALVLARASGSLFWTRIATGYLASIAVERGDLARAEALLHDTPDDSSPQPTMAQHVLGCAAVELALARREPDHASALIARLAPPGQAPEALRLLALRGASLVQLGRPAEAEADLLAAQTLALTQRARPLAWRIGIALGQVYTATGRTAQAAHLVAASRALIEELAATIDETPLQAQFLAQATALLPYQPPDTPAGRMQRPGGLTIRERDVAALIAQGKSNQAIAEALVVSRRTVESHVTNIMGKLACTSRTQIAVWAVAAGLADTAELEQNP